MDLYLSAGGMAEKCVDGDTETDYTWKGRIKSSTHKDVTGKTLAIFCKCSRRDAA